MSTKELTTLRKENERKNALLLNGAIVIEELRADKAELLAALRLFVEPATIHEICSREEQARALIAKHQL